MKNLSNLEGFKSNFDLLPKIPMRMKLAAFCLTCFLSTASAGTLYSQSARISLDMRNASVEQVLQEIPNFTSCTTASSLMLTAK